MAVALYVDNGTLSDAHQLTFPTANFSSSQLHASGKISNDTAVFGYRVYASGGTIIAFLNYNTWMVKSFYSAESLTIYSFTEIFDTNQIMFSF